MCLRDKSKKIETAAERQKNILRRLEVLLQKNAIIKMFLSGKDYGKGSIDEASFDDVIGWESASLLDRFLMSCSNNASEPY